MTTGVLAAFSAFSFQAFAFLSAWILRFLYNLIIQLMEKQAKNSKYGDGADETDFGIHSLLKIKGYIFISFHGNVLCIFNHLSGILRTCTFYYSKFRKANKVILCTFQEQGKERLRFPESSDEIPSGKNLRQVFLLLFLRSRKFKYPQ